jgi:hypothetical protein
MSELQAVPSEPEKATTRVTINKDQAMSLKIGLAIRLEVAGEVKELSRCYNDKEKYDVVIEDPIVKNITPSADEKEDAEESDDKEESLAKVSLDDLKKLISKSE